MPANEEDCIRTHPLSERVKQTLNPTQAKKKEKREQVVSKAGPTQGLGQGQASGKHEGQLAQEAAQGQQREGL